MKWLVWLLLLLNVALFGYFQLAGQPRGIQPGHEPIHPERLKLLAPEQLDQLPVAQSAASCYEWGSFSADNLARTRWTLENVGATFEVRQTAPHEAARYWVYIPPLDSQRDALARGEELRAMGVQDIFVVQEPQWRNAISLGIFKDERLADGRVQELQARGVNNVVKGVRNQDNGRSSFFISKAPANLVEELDKLKPDFPGSELKQVACQ